VFPSRQGLRDHVWARSCWPLPGRESAPPHEGVRATQPWRCRARGEKSLCSADHLCYTRAAGKVVKSRSLPQTAPPAGSDAGRIHDRSHHRQHPR
jgi:hypothetical protein